MKREVNGRRRSKEKRTRGVNSHAPTGWLGKRVVSMLDGGAEGPGSNRSRDAVG